MGDAVAGIIQSIIGNQATEWLRRMGWAGGVGLTILVAVLAVLAMRKRRQSGTHVSASVIGSGNPTNTNVFSPTNTVNVVVPLAAAADAAARPRVPVQHDQFTQNVECIDTTIATVVEARGQYDCQRWLSHGGGADSVQAVLARFRNRPRATGRVQHLQFIRAALTYLGSTGERLAHIDVGTWIDEQDYNDTEMWVGDVRELVLLARSKGMNIAVHDRRERHMGRHEPIRAVSLPAPERYRIQIELADGDQHLYQRYEAEIEYRDTGFVVLTPCHPLA